MPSSNNVSNIAFGIRNNSKGSKSVTCRGQGIASSSCLTSFLLWLVLWTTFNFYHLYWLYFWLICCNSFLSFRKSVMRRSKVYDFAQKYKSPLNLWNLNCYSYSLGRIWSLDAFFVKSRFLIEILSLEYQNTERLRFQFFNSWYVYFPDQNSRPTFLTNSYVELFHFITFSSSTEVLSSW